MPFYVLNVKETLITQKQGKKSSTIFADKKITERRSYVGRGRLGHWVTEHPTSFRIVFWWSRSIYQRRDIFTRYQIATYVEKKLQN